MHKKALRLFGENSLRARAEHHESYQRHGRHCRFHHAPTPSNATPRVPQIVTRRYLRRVTRRTDHKPASSNAAPMNTAVWLDTAGAGLSSAQTRPLQSALAHWRLSLHGSLSARLWGVGVAVGVGVTVGVAVSVGVAVGVLVGVLVAVGVAVKATHVPKRSQTAPGPHGEPGG